MSSSVEVPHPEPMNPGFTWDFQTIWNMGLLVVLVCSFWAQFLLFRQHITDFELEVRADIGEIKVDIQKMQADIHHLDSRVTTLEVQMNHVRNDIQEMREDIKEVKRDVQNILRHVNGEKG